MVTFATEFPVRPALNRASFLAHVIAWLRGTTYSTVLEDRLDEEMEGETAYLQSKSGEKLRLRELNQNGSLEAVGFRHDFPDNEGRLWRTEGVVQLKNATKVGGFIRIRTQCIAWQPGAHLDTPRKPYLVKALLQDGLGAEDGILEVGDQPHWLADDEESLKIAQSVTDGGASKHLPIVYISATGSSHWLISKHEIKKLAYDLGGVAHVLVEPSRSFSFRLRDLTAGSNAYGGTLGVVLPGRGIVRRLYLGWQLQEASDLVAAARVACLSLRSQLPADGWDWTELQEQALRSQRERDRKRLSVEESEKLYLEEIENLREQVQELKQQLTDRPVKGALYQGDSVDLTDALTARLGPEIYRGELADRLRLAARLVYNEADRIGLDVRSKAIFAAFVEKLPLSPALLELLEDLKRATKEPKRVAKELTELLLRHGYREKADNKHIRLEAKDNYTGLETITLPKTPSENRGLTNLRKQIERTLGITKLQE